MPDFSYTAKDRTGKTIEGTIQAANSAIAAGRVRELGYEVERVRPLDPRLIARPRQPGGMAQRAKENFVYPVISGVMLKDLALFYRQFATMIDAGIPLYQSLATLETQTRNPKLQGVLRDCQKQVERGGKLSEVLAAYPWIFTEIQIEMIRAAEHGGLLDRMLNRIADYLEQELELRRLISRLTLYPKIVVFMAWMILGVRFFTDTLPAASKLIIGSMGKMNYSVADYFWDAPGSMAILGLIIFGIVAFCRIVLFQSDSAREGYEHFKMGLPAVGNVVKMFALAKFGRAFAAMYEGGLPLGTAIRVAGDASGSKIIANATRRAVVATERGEVLSRAFAETGVFPPIVLDMLNTGEQTGRLDQMMNKAAEYMEGDAESKAHMYSHIFAAVVGLTVAILVGVAVIRFYMGYSSGLSAAAGGEGGGE